MFKFLYIDPERLESAESVGYLYTLETLERSGYGYETFNRRLGESFKTMTDGYSKVECAYYRRGERKAIRECMGRIRWPAGSGRVTLPAEEPIKLPVINRLIAFFMRDRAMERVAADHAEQEAYNSTLARLFDANGFNAQEFETIEIQLQYEEEASHLADEKMRARWRGVSKCLEDHRPRLLAASSPSLTAVPLQTTDLTIAHQSGYEQARSHFASFGHTAETEEALRTLADFCARGASAVDVFRGHGIRAYLHDHPLEVAPSSTEVTGAGRVQNPVTVLEPGEIVHYTTFDGQRRAVQTVVIRGREIDEQPDGPSRTASPEPVPHKEPARRLRIRPRSKKND